MNSKSRSLFCFLVLADVVLGAFVAPRLAVAAWPPLGRPVSTAPAGQMHSVVTTDAAGGAIVAWQDLRFSKVNIFAQHVLASGEVDAAWPNDGRALLNDPSALAGAAGGQVSPVIVADGAGGAIVAWLDLRSSLTDLDVYAQHVLASGVVDPAWPANGTALCAIAGQQNFLTLTSDGSGGAIATWVDSREGPDEFDIYAQHVLSSGIVDANWAANGIAVCSVEGSQGFPVIVEDGSGGAIISWHDGRAAAIGSDVYAQRVLNSGVADPAWPVDGRALCTVVGDQVRPTISSDGAHGAIVAWSDSRVIATSHIFAQHVSGSGGVDPVWPVNGRALSNAAVTESRPLAVPDGAGGAIVTWQGLTSHLNIYAQHVTAAGVVDPVWPAAGRALSNAKRRQNGAEIVPDGAGGAIVAWEDSSDVVAQHVLASGALDPAYPDTARAVCNLPSQQGDVALVATGGDGAIVTWTDGRSGVSADIYALQVLEAGTGPTGVRTPGASRMAMSVTPNPFSGSAHISVSAPGDGPVDVRIFDVLGHEVRSLSAESRGRSNGVDWDGRTSGGEPAPSGVYFCRASTRTGQAVRRLVLVR